MTEDNTTKMNRYGFSRRTKSKKRETFKIGKSLKILEELIPELPKQDESYRAISFEGGFASISFIAMVAKNEPILELTASTLRVGKKQLMTLQRMSDNGQLQSARFIVGGIMKENKSTGKSYSYYDDFTAVCEKNGWEYEVVNNHSKIILMRTADNFYVVETSSNLNENPKIEQFCFENDKGLYDFYYDIYDELFKKEGGVM